MTPHEQRIRELAKKWLNGTINPAEQQEFLQWYNNPNTDPVEVPGSFVPDELTHGIRILKNIYEDAGILTPAASEHKTPVPLFKRTWLRIAASIILLAGIGILIYNLSAVKQAPQIVMNRADSAADVKAPASVHATITLDDGRKIVIDSLSTGKVALNGTAGFVKVQDGQIVYDPNSKEQVFSTLVNPRGSRVIQVTLADGTRVWLNSESSIRYPSVFNEGQRIVEVTGQTYFEVAKNESKPFIVKKGNMQVRVLGTHFDVNTYEDEEQLAVTLLEGSVKVTNGNFAYIQLVPGEQSRIDHSGKLTKLTDVDVDKVVAWKNGKFDFGSKTDINTILRQVTRWYNLELEFNGTGKKYYGGSISRDVNLSEVLKVLETAGDIKFEIQGNRLIVLQ